MIRAVIFDMDGVIVDSEPLHLKAEKQTMKDCGVRISIQELQRYCGIKSEVMFKELIQKYRLQTTFEEIYPRHEKKLISLFKTETVPTKGVVKFIEQLKSRGLHLALASSSTYTIINIVLEKLGLNQVFEVVVSGQEVVESKPDPAIFLETVRRLRLDPRECLVFEDSSSGVQAAKAAGMKCIGFKNPNSGNQDFSRADLIIESFKEFWLAMERVDYLQLVV